MKIGQIIRAFRVANDFTIHKLSKLSGVSGSYLSELECGTKKNIRENTLYSLEKALNIPIGSVFKLHKKSLDNNLSFQQVLHEALHVMLKI